MKPAKISAFILAGLFLAVLVSSCMTPREGCPGGITSVKKHAPLKG